MAANYQPGISNQYVSYKNIACLQILTSRKIKNSPESTAIINELTHDQIFLDANDPRQCQVKISYQQFMAAIGSGCISLQSYQDVCYHQ